MSLVLLPLVLSLLVIATGRAQVLLRVGDPRRATCREPHEALREGTPAADSGERGS